MQHVSYEYDEVTECLFHSSSLSYFDCLSMNHSHPANPTLIHQLDDPTL
jgi:hypothetical protein